jgi:hypothetical protein
MSFSRTSNRGGRGGRGGSSPWTGSSRGQYASNDEDYSDSDTESDYERRRHRRHRKYKDEKCEEEAPKDLNSTLSAWLVNAYTVFEAGIRTLPWLNETLKKSFTSSVVILADTKFTLCTTILEYASSMNASSKTSWIQGQHGQLCDDEIQPLEQGSWRQFWHDGTFFMLSTKGAIMVDTSNWDYTPEEIDD